MSERIHYTQCPCCFSKSIIKVLSAKDFTVSGEVFEIWECTDCQLRFTQDIPAENEIGRYYQSEEYISHSDTNKGIVNRLYRVVRKHTLRKKRELIQKITGIRNGKLLDIGAGIGGFAFGMKESGWDVLAIEPDPAARKKGKDLYGIELLEAESFFKLPEQTFDVITMWHVLEHVHRLHPYIEQLKKILKPGGKIVIAVPNYTSHDATFYKEYWAGYDVPRHLYHFSPLSIQKLSDHHNLFLQAILPMKFDSFYVSLLSEKYKNGKIKLLSGFTRGGISNVKAREDSYSSQIYILSK